jgi:hypothetical protein
VPKGWKMIIYLILRDIIGVKGFWKDVPYGKNFPRKKKEGEKCVHVNRDNPITSCQAKINF